jgi:hypothetical protein
VEKRETREPILPILKEGVSWTEQSGWARQLVTKMMKKGGAIQQRAAGL